MINIGEMAIREDPNNKNQKKIPEDLRNRMEDKIKAMKEAVNSDDATQMKSSMDDFQKFTSEEFYRGMQNQPNEAGGAQNPNAGSETGSAAA